MKVMVIDDEPIVCKALRTLIPWEDHGFIWLGSAINGEDALHQIKAKHPDLILVDCQMPVKDGFELLQEINELNISIKSVILSGYDKFMYAQQAIKLGASDYLLKPPNLEKLLEVVLRIKAEWEQENKLKQQLTRNFTVMRERFLFELLHGVRISSPSFTEKVAYFNLPIQCNSFMIALFQYEDYSTKFDPHTYEDQQLLQFAILNITEETLQNWQSKVIVYMGNFHFVILINVEEKAEELQALRLDLERVINNVKNTLNISSNIGVSHHYEHLLEDRKKAFDDAKIAVEYKYYTGPETVIFCNDLHLTNEHATTNSKLDPIEDEKLRIAMKICSEHDLNEWINDFIFYLADKNISIHETKTLGLQYMISAANAILEIHPQLQLDEILTTEQIGSVFSSSQLDELSEIIKTFLLYLMSLTSDLRKSKSNTIVEKTKEFITQHYSENITLDIIAKEVFVSPVYLSFLFKQVETMNLTDYLANFRIEQAKHLMQSGKFKIYQIASQVGYQDEKYFSRIFKKVVGLTPTEYRNQLQIDLSNQ